MSLLEVVAALTLVLASTLVLVAVRFFDRVGEPPTRPHRRPVIMRRSRVEREELRRAA